MIKVKEFLDKHFFSDYPSTAKMKDNGYYSVGGYWTYNPDKTDGVWVDWGHGIKPFFCPNNEIVCQANGEVIIFRSIVVDGNNAAWYGYLETFEPKRPEDRVPDANGYCIRSTDDEIIRYIQMYMDVINKKIEMPKDLRKYTVI